MDYKKYLEDPMFLRELIMDHYQHPHNKKQPETTDYTQKHMAMDSCIDDITVFAKIREGIIVDVRFDGIACTISTASTSMMTELLKGKSIDQADEIIIEYQKMIDLKPYNEDLLVEAVAFKNVGKQANRIGCATIGWNAIKELIIESEEEHD